MSSAVETRTPASMARLAMIDSQLKVCGIVSPRVAGAFDSVAREEFVDPSRSKLAYVDAPQPLGNGREMMSPLSLGYLVEEARVIPEDSVLVIGAATGYAAAILAHLAGRVTALESDPALAARARLLLSEYENVEVVEGPLDKGWSAKAPYSLILVDGAIEMLPDALVDNLADGGRLATILVGPDGVARAAIGRKASGIVRPEPFAEAPARVLPFFQIPPAFQF